MKRRCAWCSRRIRRWRRLEWPRSEHCELIDGRWTCSRDCYDAVEPDLWAGDWPNIALRDYQAARFAEWNRRP